MTLLLVLLLAGTAHTQHTSTSWIDAERLARAGDSAEALERFQRILEEHPEDVEARLWIARLLRRTGAVDRAEREFRRALEQAPTHVDALTGLAAVLQARGAFDEASALLDRAEALAPSSAEVFAVRASGLRLAGRPSLAEASYARARALSPDDADIRASLEQVRRLTRHRVEATYSHEDLGGLASPARATDVRLDLHANDRLRVHGRLQSDARAAGDDVRAGGGLEWRIRPALTVRASTLLGPSADVMARADSVAEIEYGRGRMEHAILVRSMRFAGADVWIVSPGTTWWFDDRTAAVLRYYASRTAFESGSSVVNHAGAVRIRRALGRRIWLDAGYARGFESFERLSTETLGLFRADTFSSGLLVHLPGLQSISTAVEYQRRSDERRLIRMTAGIVYRF